MKQFTRYFVIGTLIGAIVGLPLLWFQWASLKTMLAGVAVFEIGAMVGGAWVYTKLKGRSS